MFVIRVDVVFDPVRMRQIVTFYSPKTTEYFVLMTKQLCQVRHEKRKLCAIANSDAFTVRSNNRIISFVLFGTLLS